MTTPSTPDASQPSTPAFATEDQAAAFAHFAPQVASIPEAGLEPWHADVGVVRTNVGRGVAAIVPHEAKVKAETKVDFSKILELPTLALALTFAVGRANSITTKKELHERQARLRRWRELGLKQAEVLAELELLSIADVQRIRGAHGGLAEASGSVELAGMLAAPSLAGKHPFSSPQLKQLAEDGNWLTTALVPTVAVHEKQPHSQEVLVRDQLWTELHRRYELLFTAGDAVWGRRAVGAHIPPLLQRAHVEHAKADPTPTPVTPTK
jgi:hypothetical protein